MCTDRQAYLFQPPAVMPIATICIVGRYRRVSGRDHGAALRRRATLRSGASLPWTSKTGDEADGGVTVRGGPEAPSLGPG